MSNEKLKPVFRVAPEVLRLVNGQIRLADGKPATKYLKKWAKEIGLTKDMPIACVRSVDLRELFVLFNSQHFLRCSFCGQFQQDVFRLIAGPKVYICNDCIEICNDILAEDKEEKLSKTTVESDSEKESAPSVQITETDS